MLLPSCFGASLIFLVVPLTLHHLIQSCGAAADGNTTNNDPYYKQCSTSGNFSNDNSPYQVNLAQLLATLPSNAINNSGFFNGTAGSAPDAVFGLVMCQADIPWPDQCNSCLEAAAAGLNVACPSSKNASAGNPGCLLRYSDTPIAGIPNDDIAFDAVNHAANVLQIVPFQRTRADLFTALSAAASISPMLLASGNRTYNSSHTLYGLAQCSRDLQGGDCSKCISSLVTNIPIKVIWSEGVSVTGFSCYIRYDLTPFKIYNPSAEEIPVAAPHNLKDHGMHQAENIAILVSISIIVLLVALIVARHYIRERKRAELREIVGLTEFSYREIMQGTENFRQERKLGEGGFGQVYKGKLLINKTGEAEIAVKRVTDPKAAKQLRSELGLMARLVHRNVVRLVGFCSDDRWSYLLGTNGRELYVCNELLSKGSLDTYIFDLQKNGREPLPWQNRYCIIRGICDGLQYLHGYCNKIVAHMDIKPSNILLGDDMTTPKIADFGLSKVFEKDKTQVLTSNVIGSHGYIAPEYIDYGKVGRACDIYSLGVLILAIVMGRGPKNRSDPCGKEFVKEIREKFHAQNQEQLKQDAALEDGDCLEDVNKCIGLALMCVDENPAVRPKADDIIGILRINDSDPRYVGIQTN